MARGVKTIAIVQSNYIPWRGYFDLIAAADEFILYDDMQYTRRDWRNRNRIKTPNGLQWLTVPVETRGQYLEPICHIRILGDDWADRRLRALATNYARALHYREVIDAIEPIYRRGHTHLAILNRDLIQTVCDYLSIPTRISVSSDYSLSGDKTGRLVDLCRQTGSSRYISGPAARDYLDVAAFDAAGIALDWFDYDGYPDYNQFWGAFEPSVTILDLLFHCGPTSRACMKF